MGIQLVGAMGIVAGGGFGLHALAQQGPLDDRPLHLFQDSVAGNYYSRHGRKTVEVKPVAEKPLAYVVGEMIGKPLTSLMNGVSRAANSLFGRWKTADATSCYNGIAAQYPDMDENSQSAVQTLCENTESSQIIQNVPLNDQGVEAIGDALLQSTAVVDFSIFQVLCDTDPLLDSLSAALQVNHNVLSLVLDPWDLAPTPTTPSPITASATNTLFQNLPCFSLQSLSVGPVTLTLSNAQTFATTMQQNPYFPLQNFSITWDANDQSPDSEFALIAQGLQYNQCIRVFEPAQYTGLSEGMMLPLSQAVGASQLEFVNLWCGGSVGTYSFNSTETEAILANVQKNLCFQGYINTVGECLPDDLVAAIQNITQGRTPCIPDPRCNIPLNCSTSTPIISASTDGSTSVTQETGFAPGVGTGGVVVAGSIVVTATLYRKRKACFRQREGAGQPPSRANATTTPRTGGSSQQVAIPAPAMPPLSRDIIPATAIEIPLQEAIPAPVDLLPREGDIAAVAANDDQPGMLPEPKLEPDTSVEQETDTSVEQV